MKLCLGLGKLFKSFAGKLFKGNTKVRALKMKSFKFKGKDFKKFFEGLGNNISECIANAKGVFDELTANARERLNDRIKDAPDKLMGLADEAANWTVKGNDGKEGGQQGEMQSEADER